MIGGHNPAITSETVAERSMRKHRNSKRAASQCWKGLGQDVTCVQGLLLRRPPTQMLFLAVRKTRPDTAALGEHANDRFGLDHSSLPPQEHDMVELSS